MRSTFIFSILIFLASFCWPRPSLGQTANALYLELGKTGLIFNLGYDHLFTKPKAGIRLTAGKNFAKYLTASCFGAGGYKLIGTSRHFLELGADLQYLSINEVSNDQRGFEFIYPDYSIKTFYPSLNAGYRNYGKQTIFRIGFSPGIIEIKIIPGGYISYGFVFK